MNGAVHYGRTKAWALEAGFPPDDAETIARADIGVDTVHNGDDWRNWGWHFMLVGAGLRARRLHARALETSDLVALGESLHCAQDSIGHGLLGHLWHWPGIDIWERRSQSVQRSIERRSREMLASYRQRTSG